MKKLAALFKKLSAPAENKKEFREQNYRFNNTAFLVLGAIFFVFLGASLISVRAAAGFGAVWPYCAALMLLTACGCVLMPVLRKKRPGGMIFGDIFTLVYYIAAVAFLALLYCYELSPLGISNDYTFVLALFIFIFFTRFDLKITLGVLTGCFALFLTVVLTAGKPPVEISAAYALSLAGAVSVWVIRVRSFVNEKKLGEMVTLDFLTNVSNRRGFDRMMERIWDEAYKTGGKVTLYMIDIDHFKRYNDLYGHLQGDKCLKAVAQAIAESMRKGDCVARYGGEEFAVLISNAERTDEERIGNRIIERVASKAIKHGQSVAPYVTVSIGCANCIPKHGMQTRTELIRMADDALYKAKENGRNTIVYYSDM